MEALKDVLDFQFAHGSVENQSIAETERQNKQTDYFINLHSTLTNLDINTLHDAHKRFFYAQGELWRLLHTISTLPQTQNEVADHLCVEWFQKRTRLTITVLEALLIHDIDLYDNEFGLDYNALVRDCLVIDPAYTKEEGAVVNWQTYLAAIAQAYTGE